MNVQAWTFVMVAASFVLYIGVALWARARSTGDFYIVGGAVGLAAASFFPAIIMGVFSRRMNREGAITGMVLGISFTAGYIVYFKFMHPGLNNSEHWWWGISPEGIGTLGMLLNFAAAWLVSRFTPRPPRAVREMVDRIRIPRGAGKPHELSV